MPLSVHKQVTSAGVTVAFCYQIVSIGRSMLQGWPQLAVCLIMLLVFFGRGLLMHKACMLLQLCLIHRHTLLAYSGAFTCPSCVHPSMSGSCAWRPQGYQDVLLSSHRWVCGGRQLRPEFVGCASIDMISCVTDIRGPTTVGTDAFNHILQIICPACHLHTYIMLCHGAQLVFKCCALCVSCQPPMTAARLHWFRSCHGSATFFIVQLLCVFYPVMVVNATRTAVYAPKS